MSMYNLIEYRNNYSKTSEILSQYCRDEPALAANAITDFIVANAITDSFKIKEKLTGEIGNNNTKNIERMVPLEHLGTFWITSEMLLIKKLSLI